VYVLAHSPLLAEPLPPPEELAEQAAAHHAHLSHQHDQADDRCNDDDERDHDDIGSTRGGRLSH
jgi:hypothetical protein